MNGIVMANRPDRLRNTLVELANGTTVHGKQQRISVFVGAIPDNAATQIFTITTVSGESGHYSCFIRGHIGNTTPGTYSSSMDFDAVFSRAQVAADNGVNSAVRQTYGAVASTNAAQININACTITVVETSELVMSVQFQIDMTGATASTSRVQMEVELHYDRFVTPPVIA